MRTQITIRHDTVDALKSHPLWEMLMAMFCQPDDQAVEVEEIRKLSDTAQPAKPDTELSRKV